MPPDVGARSPSALDSVGARSPSALRTGVILTQLGGPQKLSDVQPFLYNFFRDLIPDNIPVPGPLVKPLAWLISRWRAPYSRELYRSIGGGSPLRSQTEAQARALAVELADRGHPMPVFVAMRNWTPYSRDALRAARDAGINRLAVVPLYPQYSYSTTRSSVNELRKTMRELGYEPATEIIDQYCDDPNFTAALADLTKRHLKAFQTPAQDVHLIFSAHGLPKYYIDRGDPYLEQVRRTVAATTPQLSFPGQVHVSFQSKLGPAKWLEPATERLITQLIADGARAICVVPVAFVSEHIETLNEIDIQYAAIAQRAGIEFERVCTVKCHPLYIRCLADQVERALGTNRSNSQQTSERSNSFDRTP
jgi:protoporphyrin/coproporphyrin ferrochelatase